MMFLDSKCTTCLVATKLESSFTVAMVLQDSDSDSVDNLIGD